ncbi:small glutamine-rich tetratricopeptide repeat-containing protein 2 [Ditylenchus destructor]|nr:small glutamine-rich tetratricopeptide repeat-containing protein 2 [Ditylenchus destructor]
MVSNFQQKGHSTDTIAQAKNLSDEGDELLRQDPKKFYEALQKYSEAIRLNPDPKYYCNRAKVYGYLKRYSSAIEDCLTFSINPNHA